MKKTPSLQNWFSKVSQELELEAGHKFHSPSSLEVLEHCFDVSGITLFAIRRKKLDAICHSDPAPNKNYVFQIPCCRPSTQYLLTPTPHPYTLGTVSTFHDPCMQLLPFKILASYMALKTGISALGRETFSKEQNILSFSCFNLTSLFTKYSFLSVKYSWALYGRV